MKIGGKVKVTIIVQCFKEENCMKWQYIQPDVTIIKLQSEDVLAASDEEVFVDGGDLFD